MRITSYCHIKQNKIYLKDKLIFEDAEATGLKEFAIKSYRHFKLKYPKFFKMDDISKLGFLTAEILLSGKEFLNREKTGIVLSNSQSTLVTDRLFQESINSYEHFYPSPSVFVYTLPNIMIGEISIKNKFRGENAFFIFDRFNEQFLTDYVNMLHAAGKVNNCIGGWVDQSEAHYEAFMYLAISDIEGETGINHEAEELRKLYELI